ncbi:MAG: response regulator [Rhodospirillaceae bacterium]|nr:response regulator [Rhodospirillaceae bacterium]
MGSGHPNRPVAPDGAERHPAFGADVPEFTAGDLVIRIPALTRTVTNGEALRTFAEHPEWPCLAVVDAAGRVLGMMDRTSLTMTFARPILRDLYHRRSVVRLMHRDCLIVEMDTGLDAIGLKLERDNPGALVAGFVITDRGRYAGVANGLTLMSKALDQARLRSAALEKARNTAEAASEAKGMFLANMSHEIRTPLNGVLANLELLKLSRPDPEQAELVEAADLAAQTLLGLIGDVLDFSKIEAGRVELELIPTSLRDLAGSSVALLRSQAAAKGLRMSVHVDPDVPASVLADPHRLRQVLINLCGNAVKFTQSGGVFVTVQRIGADGAACRLRMAVHDTGIGLDPARAAALFDPFTQADGSTTRQFGGTGLGLAISKRLVERMGGSIHCAGQPGNGASFWIDLPVEAVDGGPPPPAAIASLRVLLTAECPSQVHAMEERLGGLGAFVTLAAPLAYGIATFDHPDDPRRPFDAVVVRLAGGSMVPPLVAPGGDPAVPGILVADAPDLDLRRRAHANGYDAVLPADAPMAHLAQAIATAAGRARGRSAVAASAANLEARAASLRALAQGKRVLVLEDNPMNQTVVRRQLHKLGIDHDIAGNGAEGLTCLAGRCYALVLADAHMPGMDGYEFTRRVRAAEACGDGAHLPIVAMTANAMVGEAERCRSVGMDDFLAKPVTLDALARKLEAWLSPGPCQIAEDEGPAADGDAGRGACCDGVDSVIDLAVLNEILGGIDAGAVSEVLKCFSDTIEELARDMAIAAAAGDRGRLRHAAHAAKGAAFNVAAREFGAVCRAIEERAGEADWPDLHTLVERAGPLAQCLREEIARMVGVPDTACGPARSLALQPSE